MAYSQGGGAYLASQRSISTSICSGVSWRVIRPRSTWRWLEADFAPRAITLALSAAMCSSPKWLL